MNGFKISKDGDEYIGNDIDGFMKITNKKKFEQICFVLDLSGSMMGDGISGLQNWYNRDVNKLHKYIGFASDALIINNINDIRPRGWTMPEEGFKLLIKQCTRRSVNIIFITDGDFDNNNIDWQFFADAYDEINLTYVGFCGDYVDNMKNMEKYIGKFTYTYIETLEKFKETYDELIGLVSLNPEYLSPESVKEIDHVEYKFNVDEEFKLKCINSINTIMDANILKKNIKDLEKFLMDHIKDFIYPDMARNYISGVVIYAANTEELLIANTVKNKLSILSKLGRNSLSKTIIENAKYVKCDYDYKLLPKMTNNINDEKFEDIVVENGFAYTKSYYNKLKQQLLEKKISISDHHILVNIDNYNYRKRNKAIVSTKAKFSKPFSLNVNNNIYTIPPFKFCIGSITLDKPHINDIINFSDMMFDGKNNIFLNDGDNVYKKVFSHLDHHKQKIIKATYFMPAYNKERKRNKDLPNVNAAIILWLHKNLGKDIIMLDPGTYYNHVKGRLRATNFTSVINYIKHNYDYNIKRSENGFSYVSYQHSDLGVNNDIIKAINSVIVNDKEGSPDIPVADIKLTEPKYVDNRINKNCYNNFENSVTQLLASYVDINLMAQLNYHTGFKEMIIVLGPFAAYAQYTMAALIGFDLLDCSTMCIYYRNTYTPAKLSLL